ncbi:hypothetical protein RIF29_35861 [Crotalaria pallida]|uniref:Uncharacterized protein n=1 Tax=Crotalaria pallida TaxID=3830 RepID=A0AAN9HU07_CROPI
MEITMMKICVRGIKLVAAVKSNCSLKIIILVFRLLLLFLPFHLFILRCSFFSIPHLTLLLLFSLFLIYCYQQQLYHYHFNLFYFIYFHLRILLILLCFSIP